MSFIDQYMQRSLDVLGDRTPEEEKYDNEVIHSFKNYGDIRKALNLANKIYPDEALEYNDESIRDIEDHYNYLSEHMDILAKMNNRQSLGKSIKSNKIGRNTPCPCGSGKKYKKCCMNQNIEKQNNNASWLDEDGIHMITKGSHPSPNELERMTVEYQNNIKKSPIWEEMVKEYGKEKAEELLKEFKAEIKA